MGSADKCYFEGLPGLSAAAPVAAFSLLWSQWYLPGLTGLLLVIFVTVLAVKEDGTSELVGLDAHGQMNTR